MDFKLNDYHQGVTDEELLEDVKRVADNLGNKYLSIRAYETLGKYSESTFRNRFGSWTNVQKKLGLRTERNSTEMQRITDEMMIDDLLRVASELDKNIITSTEYYEHGKYSAPTIKIRFKSWSEFISKAGLEQTGFIKRVDDIDLFIEIERIWIELGKQPTTTDLKKGLSKYSLDTFTRRFGGWRNALMAFLEFINTDDAEDKKEKEEIVDIESNILFENDIRNDDNEKNNKLQKRTPRNVNLKLRFKVLQRDNFSCCFCGASPAKNSNTELHIDHIVPWSKGGETTIGNLQTLCSICNLGKSNIEL